jgi:hypothetical protein
MWTNSQSKALDDWKQRNQQQTIQQQQPPSSSQQQQQHQLVQQQSSTSSTGSVSHPPISLRSAFGIQTNPNQRQQLHRESKNELFSNWCIFVIRSNDNCTRIAA